MSPLTFLTRPEQWLWAIHYHRATLSGAPNFAYELCIKKINKEDIAGLDPGAIRVTIGKPIYPKENNWDEIIRLRNLARWEIAKDCGEPIIDLVVAGVE